MAPLISFRSVVKKFKNFKKKNEGLPQPSPTRSPHPSVPSRSLLPNLNGTKSPSIQISPEEAAPGNDAAPYDGEGSQSDDDDAANGEEDAKSDNDAADYDDDDDDDRSPVYDKYDDDEEEAAVAEAIAAAAAAALEAAVADMPLDLIAPAFTRSTSAPNLRHRPPGGGDPDDPNTSDPRWWPSFPGALFLVFLHLGSSHHITIATKAQLSSPLSRVLSTIFILIGTSHAS